MHLFSIIEPTISGQKFWLAQNGGFLSTKEGKEISLANPLENMK